MRIDILTLFPEMFRGPFDDSIVARARARGLVEIHLWNIRDFSEDKHRVVDDTPFGGGAGMVMKVEPIARALDQVTADACPAGGAESPKRRILLMTPQGTPLVQETVTELAGIRQMVLVCGHYEGVDERVRGLVTDEISLGDFVLTGGEIPAMAVVDGVIRLLPGVLGEPASAADDSFARGLLEYPHYTRPRVFRGEAVPDVLLSGNHEAIRRWRRKEALRRTRQRRPDLLAAAPLQGEDLALLAEVEAEERAVDP